MSQRSFAALGSIVVVIAALFVYRSQLGLYFTDVDTFPLISTGRLHSFSDFINIITSPLMQGQMTNALFYRPVSSLTWGIDERIWGLNPLGYQITGLAIHVANCLVLYFFLIHLARWSGKSRVSPERVTRGEVEALAAALLFAIHPITMETVPAIARRPDLLMCFFLLLTLTSMLWYLREQRFVYLAVSGFFSVLGLLSKDSGVVISAVAVAFVFCQVDASSLLERLKACVRPALPLLLAVLFFIGLRAMVLEGIGGYAGNFSYDPMPVLKSTVMKFACVIGLPGDLDHCSTDIAPALIGVLLLLAAASGARLLLESDEAAFRRVGFAVLSLGLYFALYMATHTAALTRTMYSLIPFVCIVIAWGIVGAARTIVTLRRRVQSGSARDSRRPGSTFALPFASWLSGGIFALILLSILRTAWTGLYIDNWRASGEIGRRALESAASAMENVPEGSILLLVDFPLKAGKYWFRERPIFQEISVQGWADLAFPDKGFRIISLSLIVLAHEEPSQLASLVRYDPVTARIDITLGEGGVVGRYSSNDVYLEQTPLRQSTYLEKPEGNGLLIDLNRKALEGHSVAFLVYTGDQVVVRGLEAWSEVHDPAASGM